MTDEQRPTTAAIIEALLNDLAEGGWHPKTLRDAAARLAELDPPNADPPRSLTREQARRLGHPDELR